MSVKKANSNNLEVLLHQSDYYTLEEACQYLELAYKIKSITPYQLLKKAFAFHKSLYIQFQTFDREQIEEIKLKTVYFLINEQYFGKISAFDLYNCEEPIIVNGVDLADAVEEIGAVICDGSLLKIPPLKYESFKQDVDIDLDGYFDGFELVGAGNLKDDSWVKVLLGDVIKDAQIYRFSLPLEEFRKIKPKCKVKDLCILHDDLIDIVEALKSGKMREEFGVKPKDKQIQKPIQEPNEAHHKTRNSLSKLLYALLSELGYELRASKGKENDSLVALTEKHGVPVRREFIGKWLAEVQEVEPLEK